MPVPPSARRPEEGLAGAALLGIVGIVLMFVLGESVHVSTSIPGAALWQVLVFVAPTGVVARPPDSRSELGETSPPTRVIVDFGMRRSRARR